MVKDRENETSNGFFPHKCCAGGKAGHFARNKVYPTRGKTCAKRGAKGHRQLVVKVKVRVKRVVKQVEVDRGDPAISKLIK